MPAHSPAQTRYCMTWSILRPRKMLVKRMYSMALNNISLFSGESIDGFLWRKALSLGCDSPRELMGKGSWKAFSALPHHPAIERAKTVAGYTSTPAEELADASYEDFKTLQHIDSNIVNELHINAYRLCAECMSEEPYHRSVWQHLPLTNCRKHGNKLLFSCTFCESPFTSLAQFSYDRCEYCCYPWSCMAKESEEGFPDFQKAYLAASPSTYIKHLDNLGTALRMVIRPYDLLRTIKRISSWPPSVIDRSLVSAAHELIYNQRYHDEFTASVAESRQHLSMAGRNKLITNHAGCFIEITSIKSTNFEPIGLSWKSDQPLCLELIPSKRIDSAREECIDQDLIYQADQKSLSKLIGYGARVIKRLDQDGILVPLDSSRFRYLYDARQLIAPMKGLKKASDSPLVPIDECLPMLGRFGFDEREMVSWVFKGLVAIELSDTRESIFDGARVSRKDVFITAVKTWRSDTEGSVASFTAIKMLAITTSDLIKLIKAGYLDQTDQSISKPRVSKKCIVAATKKLFFLNRYLYAHNISRAKINVELSQVGIQPLIAPSVYIKDPLIIKTIKEAPPVIRPKVDVIKFKRIK